MRERTAHKRCLMRCSAVSVLSALALALLAGVDGFLPTNKIARISASALFERAARKEEVVKPKVKKVTNAENAPAAATTGAAAVEEEGGDSELDADMESLLDSLPSKRMRTAAGKGKKAKTVVKAAPARPEFSRTLNVGSVPERRPVLCKLLAKPAERAGLAERFDIPELSYFAANVTVRRQDPYTILVEGTIEAHIQAAASLPPQELVGTFDTLVLDTVSSGAAGSMSFDDATDYDEEIQKNGDLDIGEIAAQYFYLELFGA